MKKGACTPWMTAVAGLLPAGFSKHAAGVPAGTGTSVAQGPPAPVNPVASMTDIHDIQGPLLWGVDPAWVVYGAVALFALLLLGVLVFLLLKWRKKRGKIPRIAPEILPEEKAMAQLSDIRELMGTDGKAYYFKLSEIFRGYLHGRFGLDAMEMTSEELLPKLSALPVNPELKNRMKTLILASDPVKFAGAHPDISLMSAHHDLVCSFVQETTPDRDEPEPGAPDANPKPRIALGGG